MKNSLLYLQLVVFGTLTILSFLNSFVLLLDLVKIYPMLKLVVVLTGTVMCWEFTKRAWKQLNE